MAGNRCGYVVGPEPAVRELRKIGMHSFYSTPTASQVAAERVLGRSGDAWIAAAREQYKATGARVAARLGRAGALGSTFSVLRRRHVLDRPGSAVSGALRGAAPLSRPRPELRPTTDPREALLHRRPARRHRPRRRGAGAAARNEAPAARAALPAKPPRQRSGDQAGGPEAQLDPRLRRPGADPRQRRRSLSDGKAAVARSGPTTPSTRRRSGWRGGARRRRASQDDVPGFGGTGRGGLRAAAGRQDPLHHWKIATRRASASRRSGVRSPPSRSRPRPREEPARQGVRVAAAG